MILYKEPDNVLKLDEKSDHITGDRMSTFMMYLSEVIYHIIIHSKVVIIKIIMNNWIQIRRNFNLNSLLRFLKLKHFQIDYKIFPSAKIMKYENLNPFLRTKVPKGGYTAFPRLGIAVQPEKGSAVFWHNLRRSGRGDMAMLHGACPVLLGSKWVANKWVRETANMFHRKCIGHINLWLNK